MNTSDRAKKFGGKWLDKVCKKRSPAADKLPSRPDAAEEIRDGLVALFSSIVEFVDKYYEPACRSTRCNDVQSTLLGRTVTTVIKNPQEAMRDTINNVSIIKHCLAYAIVTRIHFETAADHPDHLLPPAFVSQYHAHMKPPSIVPAAEVTKWRINTIQTKDTGDLMKNIKIDTFANTIVIAFAPWATPSDVSTPRPAMREPLRSILEDAARIGLKIAGQEAEYSFERRLSTALNGVRAQLLK